MNIESQWVPLDEFVKRPDVPWAASTVKAMLKKGDSGLVFDAEKRQGADRKGRPGWFIDVNGENTKRALEIARQRKIESDARATKSKSAKVLQSRIEELEVEVERLRAENEGLTHENDRLRHSYASELAEQTESLRQQLRDEQAKHAREIERLHQAETAKIKELCDELTAAQHDAALKEEERAGLDKRLARVEGQLELAKQFIGLNRRTAVIAKDVPDSDKETKSAPQVVRHRGRRGAEEDEAIYAEWIQAVRENPQLTKTEFAKARHIKRTTFQNIVRRAQPHER